MLSREGLVRRREFHYVAQQPLLTVKVAQQRGMEKWVMSSTSRRLTSSQPCRSIVLIFFAGLMRPSGLPAACRVVSYHHLAPKGRAPDHRVCPSCSSEEPDSWCSHGFLKKHYHDYTGPVEWAYSAEGAAANAQTPTVEWLMSARSHHEKP